jgi:hypothetical protein
MYAVTLLDTVVVRRTATVSIDMKAISQSATTVGLLVPGAVDLDKGGDGRDRLRAEQGESYRFGGGRIGTDGKN